MFGQKANFCFVLLFAVIGLSMTGGVSRAIDFTWDGAGTTSWDDPTSWVGGAGIPDGNNDTATINIANPDPELVSNRIVGALTLSSNGDLNMNTFNMVVQNNTGQTGLTLVTGGGSDLNVEQGTLDTDNLTIQSGGEVDIRGGTVEVDFDPIIGNTGLLNGFGTFRTNTANSTSFRNDGTITATGGTLRIARLGSSTSTFDWDGTGANQAALNVNNGATLDIDMPLGDTVFNGTITLTGTSTLDTAGFTYSLSTGGVATDPGILNKNTAGTSTVIASSLTLTGAGSEVNVNAGTLALNTGFTANSGSVINLAAGSTIEFNGSTTINDGAVVNIAAAYNMTIGGTTQIISSGDFNLDGNGVLTNAVTIDSGGSLTLNVDQIDLGNNQFDSTLIMNGGSALAVNVTGTEWTMDGIANFNNAGTKTISGDKIAVDGVMNVNGGRVLITGFADFDANADVTIASGAEIELDTSNRFESGSELTVNGLLDLDGTTTWGTFGVGPPTVIDGTGTIRQDGTGIFSSDVTIDTSFYDMDGNENSNVTINSGNTVTINSRAIDTTLENEFNGNLLVNSSTLAINTTNLDNSDRPWQVGDTGQVTLFQAFGQPAPILNGVEVQVEDDGELLINSSAAVINADVRLQNLVAGVDGRIRMLTNGSALTINGLLTMNGGDIVEDFTARVNPGGGIDVVGAGSTITVTTLNWDLNDTTIQPGASLTLNVGTVDVGSNQYDSNDITINSGTLTVNNTADLWTLGSSGTINFNDSGANPTLSGADLNLFGNVNASGGTGRIVVTTLATNGTTDVNVAAGATLNLDSTNATFAGGSYAGGGTIRIVGSGLTTISANTVIDTAVLDWDGLGGDFTVNANTSFIVNSTQIDTVAPSTDGFDTGTITLENNATLAVNTASAWRLDTSGTITMNGNGVDITGSELRVFGTINSNGGIHNIDAPVTFESSATVNVNSGDLDLEAFTTFRGGSYTGVGGIWQFGDASVEADTTIALGGSYNWDAGSSSITVQSGADFTINSNTGAFSSLSSLVVANTAGVFVNGPTQDSWTIGANATVELQGAAVPVPQAVIGGTDSVTNNGLISGNGQFQVDLVNNGGTIAPGASAGTILTTLNFEQIAGGTLEIDINGLTAITEYDQLSVGLQATLAGALDVTIDGLFVPQPNDSFSVMTYATHVGEFDTITGLSIGDGRALIPVYDATEFRLVASFFGDGNLDGVVDGLDYLLWAGQFGDNPADDPPGAPENGDYNNDGMVSGLDYLLWAGNFGSNINATAVPEPTSLALMVLALCGLTCVFGRCRQR